MAKNASLAPFMSINITKNGSISPCTAFAEKIALISEVSDIKDFFYNSKALQELRKNELEGTWMLPGCRLCKENELGSGKESFNSWMNNRAGHSIQPAEPKIEHISIELSNNCNLTCVMCSSEYSSSWRKHDRSFNENGLGVRIEAQAWSLKPQFIYS